MQAIGAAWTPRAAEAADSQLDQLGLKLSSMQRQRDSQAARCRTLEACLASYQDAMLQQGSHHRSPRKAGNSSRRRHAGLDL